MVFFTCNHCGESLKKPAVEKHYQWKSCRGAPPFLTCVDCLKDFRGEEFKAHTKCITEDEKYSAKGFVAKPERNKGAQKQESWTEIIQNQLTQRKDLDNHTRNILERISNQTNVPRKKDRFINFVKNSMRISPNSALAIWSIVEKALEEFKVKEGEIKAEAAAKRKVEEEARAAVKAAEAAVDEPPKKKSKKEKKSKLSTAEAAVESPADEAPAKAKKKKDKQINEISSTTDENTPAVTNGQAKKKSKKRKVSEINGTHDTEVPGGFEWKKAITEVLQSKPKMKLEKLKTKVLKQYAASNDATVLTDKDEKKFAKHLQKLSKFVTVDGESVQLAVSN